MNEGPAAGRWEDVAPLEEPGEKLSSVTILYPGAMGSAVARSLVSHGWRAFTCLEGRRERTIDAAAAAGVESTSLDEAVASSDLVVSLVPQNAVLTTAASFAAAAQRTGHRPLYLDGNSVSPATMREVCALVEAAGARCLDGGFMGSDKMLGGRTTLYLSGPSAQLVAASIGQAFRVRVLDGDVGLASGLKLAFNGLNRGLTSMFLQLIVLAGEAGLQDEILPLWREFYPETVATVERLLPTYPRHVGRRVDELRELERWLDDLGQERGQVPGAKAVLERLEELGLESDRQWTSPEIIGACLRHHFLSSRRGD